MILKIINIKYIFFLFGLTFLLFFIIPKIYIFSTTFFDTQNPKYGILYLGGGDVRIKSVPEAVELYPNATVFISEWEGARNRILNYLQSKNISLKKIVYNCEATDTVTNFTTMLPELIAYGITDVYILTSDWHMERASWIGWIILGTKGIKIHYFPTYGDTPPKPESTLRTIRDYFRSIIWWYTGITFAEYRTSLDDEARNILAQGGCPR
jgi:uncharacterized SAM-binding protein YcdF (DUF218 family)